MIVVDIFNSVIYQPLYNGLVFLAGVMPGEDIGLAVIVLTILVKLVILPLSHKSVKTQAGIKNIEPEIKKAKEKFKNNQQEQAAEVMRIYKEHGVNPFSGCLLMFIQLPIILGLYWVFLKGLENGLDPELLYSFVDFPTDPNFNFMGLVDLRKSNVVFAVLAGVTQFLQMRIAMPPLPKTETKNKKPEGFGEEMKKNLTTQMKYVLPVIIVVISLRFPAAVPLYWIVSSGFSAAHEFFVKQRAVSVVNNKKTA